MPLRSLPATARLAILALALLSLPQRVTAQRSTPSAGRVTAQIVLGTVATPVAFIGGGLIARRLARTFGASEEVAHRAAYVGAWSAAALGSATVPTLVVRGGSYPSALAGALAGGAAAGAIIWIGRKTFHEQPQCSLLCTALGAVTFALPAVGATLVYNSSR